MHFCRTGLARLFGPFLVRKFRFFPFMGSWYILPAHAEDKALLESTPSAAVGKQTDGQGRGSALYFPAHPELLKALNSGGLGAEPPRDNLPAFDTPGCCAAAARCNGSAKSRLFL